MLPPRHYCHCADADACYADAATPDVFLLIRRFCHFFRRCFRLPLIFAIAATPITLRRHFFAMLMPLRTARRHAAAPQMSISIRSAAPALPFAPCLMHSQPPQRVPARRQPPPLRQPPRDTRDAAAAAVSPQCRLRQLRRRRCRSRLIRQRWCTPPSTRLRHAHATSCASVICCSRVTRLDTLRLRATPRSPCCHARRHGLRRGALFFASAD